MEKSLEIDPQFEEKGITNTYSAEKAGITAKQLFYLRNGSLIQQKKFLKRMSDILEIDNYSLIEKNSGLICISKSWEKIKTRLKKK